MRIGYLYDFEAYPPRGGNHVHAHELTQGFLQFGHSVLVVDDPTMPGVTNYSSEPAALKNFIKDIDILYVRIDARFTRYWGTLNRCMEFLGPQPMIWEINAPANEGLAFSWLGGKSSTSTHKKENLFRRLRRKFHAMRKMPKIILEERHRRSLVKNVSSAICVTGAIQKYAVNGLEIKNTFMLPNGGPLISEEEILERRKRRKFNGFTVLYTGSAMYPWQGLDYLNKVVRLAEHVAPEITFVMAVNQRSNILPSSKNVMILEGLNREEILDAICTSDVCIALHPEYFWSEYGFHGSPMKLFEYMACMTPAVTSNIGQMRDILRDGVDAFLCKNEPQDILEKILFVRNNKEKAELVARNGWNRIQSEFNWKSNVEKTLQVFEEFLQK